MALLHPNMPLCTKTADISLCCMPGVRGGPIVVRTSYGSHYKHLDEQHIGRYAETSQR